MSYKTTLEPSVIVLNPSEPGGSHGNVYVTWAEVMLALATLDGPKCVDFMEDVSIPAGGPYDMTNVTWRRSISAPAGDVAVVVADGATFINLANFDGETGLGADFAIVYEGTAAVMVSFSSVPSAIRLKGAVLVAAGSQPLYSGDLVIAMEDGLIAADSFEVIDTTGGGLAINVMNGGEIEADTLRGTGIVRVVKIDGSGTFNASQTNLTSPVQFTNSAAGFGRPFRGGTISSGPTDLSVNQVNRVNPTGGAFQVNLPPANENSFAWVTIAEVGGSANAVTIAPQGGDTINGATTIAAARGSRTYVSDSSGAWVEVASNI